MTQFVSLTRIRWIVDYRVDNAIHWRLKHKTGSLRVVPHSSRVSETRARVKITPREKRRYAVGRERFLQDRALAKTSESLLYRKNGPSALKSRYFLFRCLCSFQFTWRKTLMLVFASQVKTIRQLKQRRFWATHVNRKWGIFPLNMPWWYKICIP